MDQPALFELESVPPEVETCEDWCVSVRLTLEEVEAVASGQVPESLRQYCADGLVALRGTPEEALLRANARLRETRVEEMRHTA